PDVIVTQTQCDVCAVSQEDVERALGAGLGFSPQVVSLEPNALGDVWSDIAKVAVALGVPERGRELIARLRQRIDAIAARTQHLPRPRVACLEWLEPLMSAGNWMPELVELAGGRNLFGQAGKHSPNLAWEDVLAQDPDVIVALPCGLDLVRTRE